jgi:uncharacterized protein
MGSRIGNDDLHSLVQLQELDVGLKQLREKLRRMPIELALLDQELTGSRQTVESVLRHQEEGLKERRKLENEVEALRLKLSKYRDQLMAVKTNKEYQAVLSEIANCEKEISAREDRILDQMMLADEWDAKQRLAKNELAEKERDIQGRRSLLEAFLTQAQAEMAGLEQRREELRHGIVPELIQRYERIAIVRQGVAVAQALDGSCQACHVRLRPQYFHEVKANQQILTCESCNRILYYPEPQ